MTDKTKAVYKTLKAHGTIWHPESTLVFKSKADRVVIGRFVDDELIPLDEEALELCKQFGYEPDESLLDAGEEGDDVEEEEPQPPPKKQPPKSAPKVSQPEPEEEPQPPPKKQPPKSAPKVPQPEPEEDAEEEPQPPPKKQPPKSAPKVPQPEPEEEDNIELEEQPKTVQVKPSPKTVPKCVVPSASEREKHTVSRASNLEAEVNTRFQELADIVARTSACVTTQLASQTKLISQLQTELATAKEENAKSEEEKMQLNVELAELQQKVANWKKMFS